MPKMQEDERQKLTECFIKLYDKDVNITTIWTEFETVTQTIRSRFVDKDVDQSNIVWHKQVGKVADDVINLGVRCDQVKKKGRGKGRPRHNDQILIGGQGCPKSKQMGRPRKVAVVKPVSKVELSPLKPKESRPRLTSWRSAIRSHPESSSNLCRPILKGLTGIKRPPTDCDDGAGPSTPRPIFGGKRPSLDAVKWTEVDDQAQTSNGQVHNEVRTSPTKDYRVYIPTESTNSLCYDKSIKCPGCDEEFSGTQIVDIDEEVIGEPEYFIHCAKECPEYKNLLLSRSCHECSIIFIEARLLEKHQMVVHEMTQEDIANGYRMLQSRNKVSSSTNAPRLDLLNLNVPPRPKWMTKRLYYNRKGQKNNSMTPCLGCDQLLPVYVHGKKTTNSVQFLVHCIQECPKYQKLNLVRTCSTCGCKFLNKLSLISHQSKGVCEKDI